MDETHQDYNELRVYTNHLRTKRGFSGITIINVIKLSLVKFTKLETIIQTAT